MSGWVSTFEEDICDFMLRNDIPTFFTVIHLVIATHDVILVDGWVRNVTSILPLRGVSGMDGSPKQASKFA